jgi:hypothetical protein
MVDGCSLMMTHYSTLPLVRTFRLLQLRLYACLEASTSRGCGTILADMFGGRSQLPESVPPTKSIPSFYTLNLPLPSYRIEVYYSYNKSCLLECVRGSHMLHLPELVKFESDAQIFDESIGKYSRKCPATQSSTTARRICSIVKIR